MGPQNLQEGQTDNILGKKDQRKLSFPRSPLLGYNSNYYIYLSIIEAHIAQNVLYYLTWFGLGEYRASQSDFIILTGLSTMGTILVAQKKKDTIRYKFPFMLQYPVFFHPLDKIFPQKCCCHFKSLNCACSLKKDCSFVKITAPSSGDGHVGTKLHATERKHLDAAQGSTEAGALMAGFRCFWMMNDNIKLLLEGSIQ